MHASLLAKHGLVNVVAGTGYNFRYQKTGDNIIQDVEKVLQKLGVQPREIYSGQQIHGAKVAYADGENGEDFVFGKTFPETDGLVTDKPGVALLIKTADCTPVILFDPVKRVQASVHSGWRGTVQRISLVALEKMQLEFGCELQNILAYVGPSIDQENYEVGAEVYEAFEGFLDRDQFFFPRGEKYHLSMTDANFAILKEAGIRPENIEVERASTYTDSNLHSARGEGKEYQLNGIFTMMV